ncbi:SDR family oxidoreductase [Oricola sp.]|uniref:SDR family oxidoreductase n=1 Tax=Oricola sp. TaxID=1979950 RepID=UPI003BACB01E
MTDGASSYFIFGAGFSGRAFGRLAAQAGHKVVGTTRSAEKADALRDDGIAPLVFNGVATDDIAQALASTTHLVISIAPGETGDPVLTNFATAIASMPKLEWIAYLSTVGVYGNHDGAWVDEETECRPVSQRSIQRVAAEEAWRVLAETTGKPLAILRLSGIYGPGRNGLINLEKGKARRLVKKDQVFNRIHVEDIARALVFLGEARTGGVFNITDDEPAPPQEVVAFASKLMGKEPPPEIDFETAELSPMARSFYGENKRVSNAKVKAAGFTFAHATYRDALTRMWTDGNWR